jgi:hypothetical protein
MAYYLQHGPKRKVLEAFRGVGKSVITEAFVAWELLRKPEQNILVVSASKSRADNFTTVVLQLICDMPELQHLQPRTDQRCSKLQFDVGCVRGNTHPSVVSAGITGMITGTRADLIVPDDIETPNNSATPSQREKLSELIKEFDAIIKPGGRIVFLGTPQTESSIYNVLANDRGYDIKIWPVRYPSDAEASEYGSRLAPGILEDIRNDRTLIGSSTEPLRFSEEDLRERELSYGRSGFRLQFMLDTRLSDENRYPLRLSDLVIHPCDIERGPERLIWSGTPEYEIKDLPIVGIGHDRLYRPIPLRDEAYHPYTGKVMYIDPSGRGKDETGFAVVACLHSTLFLLDAGGYVEGYSPETLEALAKTAAKCKVQKILVEPNFGGGMFTSLFKPVLLKFHQCSVEDSEYATTMKEKRIIDTLEPVLSSHRLVVDRALILRDWQSTQHRPIENRERDWYQLFYQLTRITNERRSLMVDDRLDALAGAVAYFQKHLETDADKLATRTKERLLDAELQRFKRHVVGGAPKAMGWG